MRAQNSAKLRALNEKIEERIKTVKVKKYKLQLVKVNMIVLFKGPKRYAFNKQRNG